MFKSITNSLTISFSKEVKSFRIPINNRFKFKNLKSFISLLLILFCFLSVRFAYFENNSKNGYNATSWDAFGYYMYLPSVFIYHDVKKLKWIPKIDKEYNVTGGELYQATKLDDRNYTNKYLAGVAILQIPFFFVGHVVAGFLDFPQDGFSWPYQYAILFSAIFWCFLGFVVLRKVLLFYFDDKVTSRTLILIALASNLIQYTSVDGGMSHAYIFPLYSFVLWLTHKWHRNPKRLFAFLIGLTSGLAMISRPTELLIILIPILWLTNTKEEKLEKKKLILNNKNQIILAVAGGILAVLPQLLYWRFTTGSFIYDVGSKWYFLNPWFRVLFGSEKGWFLYTPVTILMILGFFYMKYKPFKKAVIIFCLLNIWVVISWSDWKYGASYSTRALVQSYPVFALPLASFITSMSSKMKYFLIFMISSGLIFLNLYQMFLYNRCNLENFSPFLRLGKLF